ncbi:MAG: hypothetical protein JWQ37_3046 [Blastococcus sp.]|jgi:hypothetical protein|nr:hypothetical protein [Blastococcus sp.]
MLQAGAALLGLAVLISATQWLWTRVVAHVDPLLIPACSRRRVQRLMTNSAHIYLASVGVVACVVCVEAAVLLG